MAAVLALTLALAATVGTASAQSFSNTAAITIPDGGASSTSSSIAVSGLTGGVLSVTVQLNQLTTPVTSDLDMLLVAPSGRTFVFLSDVGGSGSSNIVTLMLSDAAATSLPSSGSLFSGTYKPTDVNTGADVFPAPAPGGPYASAPPNGTSTFASTFTGTVPNGTWTLYIVDDTAGGGASTLAGGWTLTLTSGGDVSTATALTSSLNPSFTAAPDNVVQFTATVTAGTSPITTGSVTFRDGANMMGSPVPLDAAGHAVLSTSTLTEGTHTIEAFYSGPVGLGSSSNSLTQRVDRHTTVAFPSFCNDGAIAIPDGPVGNALATPYPSRLFVTGVPVNVTGFTISLRSLTENAPPDLDLLLVGPGGQKFVLMGGVGAGASASGLSLVLADSAASALPASGPLTSGNWKPTAYNVAGLTSFPLPAPAGPYAIAKPFGSGTIASVFGGTSPNGTWSLYVIDDTAGSGAGSLAGGWCLDFTPSLSAVGDADASGAGALRLGISPDPMSSNARLVFTLPRTGAARLELFDAAGRLVRTLLNGPLPAGVHDIAWDGRDDDGREAEPGAYFARLHAANAWSVQRFVRLR